VRNFTDHLLPLTLSFIEWCLNGIRFELNSFWLQMAIVVLYGLLNISITKLSGSPVYPAFKWDTPISWLTGLSSTLLFALVFIV
jgi:hypothetical protein